MIFFYSIAIKAYILSIYIASPFYTKAKKAILGRKNFFKQHHKYTNEKFIWFHCASLGEFEQGRPLIEKIKTAYPHKKILLTFFSPSGFEIRKDYPFADVVAYLPFDTKKNVRKFLALFNIEMAIFVKYDLWPFYLNALIKNKIPTFLISAVFRENHFFFKWYGSFLKKFLKNINAIFVQDLISEKMAKSKGFNNVLVSGDSRVDRVIAIKNENKTPTAIHPFLQTQKAVIFGSIWPEDELVIDCFIENLKEKYPIIIAPHSVEKKYVDYLLKKYKNAILWSEINNFKNENILIIDNIGTLNKLYKTAAIVYIGGGFKKSIHNILEPAIYGIPLFFGTQYQKFREAKDFIENKIAFSANNPQILAQLMNTHLLNGNNEYIKNTSENWFLNNLGANEIIFTYLTKNNSQVFRTPFPI